MSFETEFLDLMTDTVTVNTFSTWDAYGKPSHSTASSSYSARVVKIHKLVRTPDGTEKLATTLAWIASTGFISPNDKITLPDGTSPVILTADAYPDEDGRFHHIKILFGN
jgi:hypothetical protein